MKITKKGDCEFHVWPSCHPAQVEPLPVYGCVCEDHPGYYPDDFCPIVYCNGNKSKCEIKEPAQ